MAEKTSLNLSMTNTSGDKLTKAVPDINPNADNAALNAFALGLADLTTNTLVSTSKITKTDISGNFYLPSITIITTEGASSIQPTKIDDSNFTFNAASFLSSATDAAGMFKFQYFVFNVKANNIDISNSIHPFVVTNSPSTPGVNSIFVSCKINTFNDSTANVENFQVMILTTASSADDLKKESFKLVIPAGSQGDLQWDSNYINFTFV